MFKSWLFGGALVVALSSFYRSVFAFPSSLNRSCVDAFEPDALFLKSRYEEAVRIAEVAHGSMSYGDLPFMSHLRRVSQILAEAGYSPYRSEFENTLFVLAMLHDVLEDTQMTPQILRTYYAADIVSLVQVLSNRPCRPGESEQAARQRTYVRLGRYPAARIVKLADRIANVEDSLQHAAHGEFHYLNLYAEEWPGFQQALFVEIVEVEESNLQGMLTALMTKAQAINGARR